MLVEHPPTDHTTQHAATTVSHARFMAQCTALPAPVAPVRFGVVLLRRIVRSSLPSPTRQPHAPATAANGYGGIPAVDTEDPGSQHIELLVTCRGQINPDSGYFLDIKSIDKAVRTNLLPALCDALRSGLGRSRALIAGLNAAAAPLAAHGDGTLHSVLWLVTPTASLEVYAMNPATVLIRQKFEIAAAHRLYVPTLSDEQNRALFGKCASPGGHGHNYVIEPCVRVDLPPSGPPAFTLHDLERLTATAIIEPFDHKNLNADCPAFDQTAGGVNPSVENISKVLYHLLAPAVARGGATLAHITVWETPKTSSTYPAASL